jgi:hypothetical protein
MNLPMPRVLTSLRPLIAACGVCLIVSCGGEVPPRPSDEIFRERAGLPTLYLTAKTHQRVIAAGDKGLFVDENSGEVCWPALACHAPNCPGRHSPDEPFVFNAPDPAFVAKPDGTVGYDHSQKPAEKMAGACPECLKGRNLKTESPQVQQNFIDWVQPYVLPETAKRLKRLDEESQRRIQYVEQRRNKGA